MAKIIFLGDIIIFTWTIILNLPSASPANFAIPFLVVDLKQVWGVRIPRKITREWCPLKNIWSKCEAVVGWSGADQDCHHLTHRQPEVVSFRLVHYLLSPLLACVGKMNLSMLLQHYQTSHTWTNISSTPSSSSLPMLHLYWNMMSPCCLFLV